MKKVVSFLTIILLIVLGTINVQAETAKATATLVPDKTEAKPGDEISVILKINCEDGINGLESFTCNYNKENLELVSSDLNDTKNFTKLDDLIMCNTENKVKTSEIYVFNFKVKDTAKTSEEEITINELKLHTDAEKDDIEILKSIKSSSKIKITSNEQEEPKQQEESKENNSNEKADTNKDESNAQNNDTKVSNEKSTGTTNTKTIPKELAKTGRADAIIIAGLVIAIAGGIVAVRKYNKYNIK